MTVHCSDNLPLGAFLFIAGSFFAEWRDTFATTCQIKGCYYCQHIQSLYIKTMYMNYLTLEKHTFKSFIIIDQLMRDDGTKEQEMARD